MTDQIGMFTFTGLSKVGSGLLVTKPVCVAPRFSGMDLICGLGLMYLNVLSNYQVDFKLKSTEAVILRMF